MLMLTKMFLKINYNYFKKTIMKKTEIEKMLKEGKSAKEIAETLKTNVAYVYNVKKKVNDPQTLPTTTS
jgi:DNA-binding CsgD family transcriptional regulator